MIDFVKALKKEIGRRVEKIERSEVNTIKKALEASQVLGEAFDRLKDFIVSYRFENEEEEILFFREIKPRLFCKLIYYRKLYNIEMDRPIASIETQKDYLRNELDAIGHYTKKRLDFIRYYRSGQTYLDSLYFVRGKTDTEQYQESFYNELDKNFSTNCDFKVARILANDMLSVYLMSEIEILESRSSCNRLFPATRITWMGTKAELNEQIFAWDSKGSFGNVPLTQLSDYIQNVFNVEMDRNLSRTFSDMRIRNNPTPYLDELKEALLKRIRRGKRNGTDKNKKGGKGDQE